MRNIVLPVLLILVLISDTGCLKDNSCTPKSAASEVSQIQAYATANSINATAHSSGLYYEVIDPGTGTTATTNSNIVITYTGKLMNGTKFDEQLTPNNTGANPPWPLNQLIEGWRLGIPLIKEGGRIKLIIPSSLAYGCTGKNIIPGDAVLFFDISLVDIQ